MVCVDAVIIVIAINIASSIITTRKIRTSTHEGYECGLIIAQFVVAADVQHVAAVRVTGDRLELDLVQPVSDANCQDVHSLRLQPESLRHGRLLVVRTTVRQDDDQVGDVAAVSVSRSEHGVRYVAQGGGRVGRAVGVRSVEDRLLHVVAEIH